MRDPFVLSLRQNATPAEAALWQRLRQTQLHGLKFRRQAPMGPYVLDFFCDPARLAIEIDGATHANPTDDAHRTAYLETRTIQVLRFWNNEVLTNIDGVLQTIHQAALERLPPGHTPKPRRRP